jgi:hypothetical protein
MYLFMNPNCVHAICCVFCKTYALPRMSLKGFETQKDKTPLAWTFFSLQNANMRRFPRLFFCLRTNLCISEKCNRSLIARPYDFCLYISLGLYHVTVAKLAVRASVVDRFMTGTCC